MFTHRACSHMIVSLILALGIAAAATASVQQQIEIALTGALSPDASTTGENHRDLYLGGAVEDGRLGMLLGTAPDFNRGMHRGRVLEGALTEGSLLIEVAVSGDPWIPGGRGEYRVRLQPAGEDRFEGTFEGVFQRITRRGEPISEIKVQGAARAELTPPLSPAEGFTAPAPGEHPRMLMRVDDRERLRELARTPLGQVLARRVLNSDNIIALGLAYQLTGNRDYAMRAIPTVREMMADESPGAFYGSDGAYAKRVGDIVQAYDLCYTAWPEDFRNEVTAYLARRADTMLFRPNTVTTKTNWSPNSNYSGHFNGAGGLAGLAIFDKKGPRPTPPVNPGNQAVVIRPPEGLDVSTIKNAPVSAMTPGIMPQTWLYAGPWPNPDQDMTDLPAAMGGQANATPGEGTEVKFGETTLTFTRRGKDIFWDRADGRPEGMNLELMAATDKTFNSTNFFFTILRVSEKVTVQFRQESGGGHSSWFWLSGHRIHDGDFLVLEAGDHPMMIRTQFHRINPWGKSWLRPNFQPVTDEQVKEGLQGSQILYGLARRQYEEDLAYWEANDGASAYYHWLKLCGVLKATDYHRYKFGDGGFQVEGEGYTSVGVDMPLLFETAFRNTFGHPSTGRPDVSHFGPRYIAQTIYSKNGVVGHQSFSLTDGTIPASRWSLAFPSVPAEWRGASLWAWNLAMGIENGGVGRSALERGDDAGFINQVASSGGSAAMLLLFYPFDLRPQHPEGIIPRVWEARTKGLYVFRNGWNGSDDIVAQLFLKSEGEGGWANQDGGSFRLFGLGVPWSVRGNGVGKTRERAAETVVVLPENPEINTGMRAMRKAFEAGEDGSGLIVADMNLIYASARTEPDRQGNPRRLSLVDNRFQLRTQNFADSGITGLRSLGVDYSGKSGAAGLFVLTDMIEGGKSKLWSWQLPPQVTREQVTFTDNGFTIRQASGVLRATFISPAEIEIGFSDRTFSRIPAQDRATQQQQYRLHAIHATDRNDPSNGRFIVVVTLDADKTPKVTTTTREARRTTVEVGGQTVVVTPDGKVSFGNP